MNLSKKVIVGFTLVITLSVLHFYINYLLTEKVNRNTEFLTKSESIIRNSSNIHKDIIQMQSAFRGFLLTGDLAFISTYNSILRELPKLFNDERSLIQQSAQKSKLDSIRNFHNVWINYSDSLIIAKKKSLQFITQDKEYQNLVENRLRKQVGKRINDEIAQKFAEFDAFEYKVRSKRTAALSHSIRETHRISLLFIFITIISSIICTFYISRSIFNRITYMVSLASQISEGKFETVIDHKKDELSDLSTSLNKMSTYLRKNISELERRNIELSQFASVVSHDLKAPLRGIHNVVSWIEEDVSDSIPDTLKKYLKTISERISRMESLINGLLDYTRVSEELPVRELIDLHNLVHDIFDSIVPANFQVNTQNLPLMYIDRLRIEQVFSNLISNAVKYAKAGGGKITVTCREMLKWYEFSVKDDGIGIDPKYHDRIFMIFQTLRDKDSPESTGIGLSIVKKILDEHLESIKIESKLGAGSTFTFTWHK